MKLLILLLVSPAIFAQKYRKSNDPNEEPFLPIFPVFPYSPKLIKRGTDREVVSQLTSELYAPKVDSRDSYTTSFSSNYQRDPYYPNYNPYPKSTSPSTYSTYYGTNPYPYSANPYSIYNSYASAPYAGSPTPYSSSSYSPVSYPSYYYQPPVYYPNYYNQPLFAPPPPPPPPTLPATNTDYSESSKDATTDSESSDPKPEGKEKKSGKVEKSKESDVASNQDSTGNQFVDGGNFISANSKDLDGQSSTYKVASPYNHIEQLTDMQLKNLPLPLPRTTYRVVSVAGQPVGPDYPLPPAYAKAQQFEQLMSQTLAKLLAQQNVQQASQQQLTRYPTYDVNQNVLNTASTGAYGTQNTYDKEQQSYVNIPSGIAKTGLGYVMNPNMVSKVNVGQVNPSQLLQTTTSLTRTTQYPQKVLTRVALVDSPGVYVPPVKTGKTQGPAQQTDYDSSYDNQSPQIGQNYDVGLGQVTSKDQSYESEQGQAPVGYQNQNYVTVQTPQAYNYQYSGYNPSQSSQVQQQQSQQYKTSLDDVNFGAKQNPKG